MDSTSTITDNLTTAPDSTGHCAAGILVLFSAGVAQQRVWPLRGETAIGRSPEREISVHDPNMSRHHATVRTHAEGICVRDEGSRNGTFVNGAPIKVERPVCPGDIIRCGGTLLMPVADVDAYAGWPRSAHCSPLDGGPDMQRVRETVDVVASRRLEILVIGESGTGKEVVARMLHAQSGRAGHWVAINCAAVPPELFEAELFGVNKGAFTGAERRRDGLMAAAHGGTLFLDEVAELPLQLQAKLLRALELREYRPLGSTESVRADIRLVAAANRPLQQAVEHGRFRGDLMHRLCGLTIELSPLRHRREDIVVLTDALLDNCEQRPSTTFQLVEHLLLHNWPGNVRELHRTVEEALVRAQIDHSSELKPCHLRTEVLTGATPDTVELGRIRQALSSCRGNVRQAASKLGIRRQRIYELLRIHGIRPGDFRV